MNINPIKIFLLIIISITFILCKGQKKKETLSLKLDKVSEVNKIPIPKNGFSNAYVDIDSTLWFSSNGGGLYHYDGKTFKNYTGQTFSNILFIFGDLEDNIWYGGKHRIWKFDGQMITQITTNE